MSALRPICAFPDCGRPLRCYLLCSAHLAQAARHGALHPIGKTRHRLPIDCPLCGAATYARTTQHGNRLRDCTSGHRLAFTATGEFIRELLDQKPDPRPCDFPGCGRARKDRFCVGHTKQRWRYGENGMKPLMSPVSRMTPEERAEMHRRSLAGMRAAGIRVMASA